MKTVLITASNLSPVGINTIFSLRDHFNLVCVDINPLSDNVARLFGRKYFQVPFAKDKEKYVETIIDICNKEKVEIILPLTIEETIVILENRTLFHENGILIANNNSLHTINMCFDKWLTVKHLVENHIDAPNTIPVDSADDIRNQIKIFDYPSGRVVFKPRRTHGSRGFKIISDFENDLSSFINLKPTDYNFIRLDYLCDLIGKKKIKAVLMDYLDGSDYSVYAFCVKGETLVTIPMKRTGLIPGMSTGGILENNGEIIKYVKEIARAFNFSGAINLQMKFTDRGPRLYEINTRISATTVITRSIGINFPLCEILLAENKVEEIKKHINAVNIHWGLKCYRFHKEVYKNADKLFMLD